MLLCVSLQVQVNDVRPSTTPGRISGTISVVAAQPLALFAYVPAHDIFNTAGGQV